MKRLVVLAGLAAAMLTVAACNSQTPGQASGTTTTDGGGTQTTSGGGDTSTSTGGSGSLPVDQPCSLLSSADLQQLGVSDQPTQDMVGTAHTCELDTDSDHIIVGIRTNAGLADLTGPAAITDTQVGHHQAKEMKDTSANSCLVSVGVSDTSRIDVTATGDGTDNPCTAAENAAKLVEPRLP